MDDTSDGAPPLGFDHKGERAKVKIIWLLTVDSNNRRRVDMLATTVGGTGNGDAG